MKLLRFVKDGEIPPVGLSEHRTGYRLRMPVWAWHRKGFDICWGAKRTGWWVLNVVVKTERDYACRTLTLRWGWVLVKETAPAEGYA